MKRRKAMGLVNATIILKNPKEDKIKEMGVEALVDCSKKNFKNKNI